MKRTGEIVLTIIGMIIYAFTSVIGFSFLSLKNNDLFISEMEAILAEDPAISGVDINVIADIFSTGGLVFAIVSIVAIILGIVSIILAAGNKKPKAAGITLIIVAVLSTLGTFLFAFLGGLLYLIAGIMCLVRKPKQA